MDYQNILRLSQNLQTVSLAKHNLKFALKKKKKTSEFVTNGVNNIVSSSLIKEGAQFLS